MAPSTYPCCSVPVPSVGAMPAPLIGAPLGCLVSVQAEHGPRRARLPAAAAAFGLSRAPGLSGADRCAPDAKPGSAAWSDAVD